MTMELLAVIAALCGPMKPACVERLLDCSNRQIMLQLADPHAKSTDPSLALAICIKRGELK